MIMIRKLNNLFFMISLSAIASSTALAMYIYGRVDSSNFNSKDNYQVEKQNIDFMKQKGLSDHPALFYERIER